MFPLFRAMKQAASAEKSFRLVLELGKKGDHKQALDICTKLLDQHSHDVHFRLRLALLQIESGREVDLLKIGPKKTGNLLFWLPDESAYRFSLDNGIIKSLDKKNIVQYIGAHTKSLALMNEAISIKNHQCFYDTTQPEMRRIHSEHGLLLLMGKIDEAQNAYDLVCAATKPQAVKYNCKSNYERFLSNSAFIDVINKKYDKAIEGFSECMKSNRDDTVSVARHNLIETQLQKAILIENGWQESKHKLC